MKKIFKTNLLFFIIGCIISSLVITVALNFNAEDIEYKNDKSVKDELDSLLESSNYETYDEYNYIDASKMAHRLRRTNNKLLEENITIKKIPDYYKILTETTTATAADIISGKRAYNSSGTLLTGKKSAVSNCSYGTFTCTECRTSTGQSVPVDYKPSKLILMQISSTPYRIIFYDKELSTTTLYPNDPLSTYVTLNNNSVVFKNFGAGYTDATFAYYYCK